jgi:hypothetical protein
MFISSVRLFMHHAQSEEAATEKGFSLKPQFLFYYEK